MGKKLYILHTSTNPMPHIIRNPRPIRGLSPRITIPREAERKCEGGDAHV
jgi:hypothetical protein